MHLTKLSVLAILFLQASCVTPVRRDRGGQAGAQIPTTPTSANAGAENLGSEKVEALPQPEALKKRIWVLDFAMSAEVDPSLKAINIAEIMRRAVLKQLGTAARSAYFPVSADDSVLREIEFDSTTHPLDVAKAARGSSIAGFLRANVDVVELTQKRVGEGIISTHDIDFVVGTSFQFVDAGTGKELARGAIRKKNSERRSEIFSTEGNQLSDPKGQVEKLSEAIAISILNEMNRVSGKLGWSGRVLKLEGARLYLNAGRSSGIRLGDVLKIVEAPRDIFDPKSSQYIGQAPGRVKGTLKVIQYFGLDGAIGVLQSGGGILPGDRIELL